MSAPVEPPAPSCPASPACPDSIVVERIPVRAAGGYRDAASARDRETLVLTVGPRGRWTSWALAFAVLLVAGVWGVSAWLVVLAGPLALVPASPFVAFGAWLVYALLSGWLWPPRIGVGGGRLSARQSLLRHAALDVDRVRRVVSNVDTLDDDGSPRSYRVSAVMDATSRPLVWGLNRAEADFLVHAVEAHLGLGSGPV